MSERKHPAVSGRPVRLACLTALALGLTTVPSWAGALDVLRTKKTSPPAAPAAPASPIVARVNGVEITRDQLAKECIERSGVEVLETLVNRAVVEQACRNRGISISAEDLDREVQSTARKFGVNQKQWLDIIQKERHISPERYARDIVWPALALKKLAEGKIVVSEEDLKKSFEATYGEKVRCRIVMVEKQQLAKELWERVKKSHNDLKVFEEVAKNYSIDESSRSLGGQTQPIGKYTNPQNLADEAFSLKPGELSSIIEVSKGAWVFMYCEGRVPAEPKTLDQVRKQLHEFIYDQRLRVAISNTFQELQKQAHIENLLTAQVNLNPAETAAAEKKASAPQGGASPSQDPANPGSRPVGN